MDTCGGQDSAPCPWTMGYKMTYPLTSSHSNSCNVRPKAGNLGAPNLNPETEAAR